MNFSSPVIIKVGTNVLKDKLASLDQKVMKELVEQIATLYKKGEALILVTSGAVGTGRTIKKLFFKKNRLLEKQVLASLGQPHLIYLYHQFFSRYGINVAQILLTRANFKNRKEYLNLRQVLESLLENKIIPIINENDSVAVDEFCFSDNDQLAVLAAIAIDAREIFFLSNVEGLYDSDPKIDHKCRVIPQVDKIDNKFIEKVVGKAVSLEGRGGMISKLQSIDLAMRAGINCYLVKGTNPQVILKVMSGQRVGTKFVAQSKTRDVWGRKKWLLAGAMPAGEIIIDEGAASSLRKRKSLLAVGIVGVKGKFRPQEVVQILSEGKLIASGITNYSSAELNSIDKKDKKALRKPFPREVVHLDNLILFK